MADEALIRSGDFEAIEAAVMETARGRWFLSEYVKRNRAADTGQVMGAIDRLMTALESRVGQPSSATRGENDQLRQIGLAMAEARELVAAIRPAGAQEKDEIGAPRGWSALVAGDVDPSGLLLEAASEIQELGRRYRQTAGSGRAGERLAERAVDIYAACSGEELIRRRIGVIAGLLEAIEAVIAGKRPKGLLAPEVRPEIHAEAARSAAELIEAVAEMPAPALPGVPATVGVEAAASSSAAPVNPSGFAARIAASMPPSASMPVASAGATPAAVRDFVQPARPDPMPAAEQSPVAAPSIAPMVPRPVRLPPAALVSSLRPMAAPSGASAGPTIAIAPQPIVPRPSPAAAAPQAAVARSNAGPAPATAFAMPARTPPLAAAPRPMEARPVMSPPTIRRDVPAVPPARAEAPLAPAEAVTSLPPAEPAPRRSLAEDSAALALAVEEALRDEIVPPHEDPTEGMSRAEITALLS